MWSGTFVEIEVDIHELVFDGVASDQAGLAANRLKGFFLHRLHGGGALFLVDPRMGLGLSRAEFLVRQDRMKPFLFGVVQRGREIDRTRRRAVVHDPSGLQPSLQVRRLR